MAFARLDLRPTQLTFLRHSQVRRSYNGTPHRFPEAAERSHRSLKSQIERPVRPGTELSRRHGICASPSQHTLYERPPTASVESPRASAESIARRRTGPGSISCTPARADFLSGIPRRLLGIPRRIASMAPTGTLPVPFGYSLSGDLHHERRDPGFRPPGKAGV